MFFERWLDENCTRSAQHNFPAKCLHNTTYRADFRPVCPVVVIQPFQQTTAYTTINISYRLRINHATDRIKAKSGKAPQDAEINTEDTVGAELPYRLGTSSPKERHIYHHIGAGDVLDHFNLLATASKTVCPQQPLMQTIETVGFQWMKKAFPHFCIYPLPLTQDPPIPNTVAPPTTWQRRNTQNQHTSLPHHMHAKEEQKTGIYQLPYGNIARHTLRPGIRNPPPPPGHPVTHLSVVP